MLTFRSEAADLRIRFVYDGEPPKPKPLVIDRDKPFCGDHDLLDESLLVNAQNNGIANVLVYLYTSRAGTDLKTIDVPAPKNRRILLSTDNCRFDPRILIARTGDTLVWNTTDRVGHNPNVAFLNNTQSGLFHRVNAEQSIHLPIAEPAPISVTCHIHPWEMAWVAVLDHPFAAVSDNDGLLEIKGLPSNQPLDFRAYHEVLDFKQRLTVDGQATKWHLNRFERTLASDDSDVITVVVPPPPPKQNQP